MKKVLILLCLFIVLKTSAQEVGGYWYGTANAGNVANNYLVELILKQNGSSVQGVINYYFKNTFRSFKINGTYNSSNRYLSLHNIPLTFYGSTALMEVDCPMDFEAQMRVSKVESNLAGKFVSKGSYRYTCPDVTFNLKLNKDADNHDSILTALRVFKEAYQVWTPSPTDTLVAATIIQRPVINYVVSNQFKERKKVIAEEIIVDSDTLKVDFYDNGEIDGDSISVFYNDQLLASNQRLSTKAIHMSIALDPSREVNEITMFADNLGSIPPNTALMIVYDGRKRYEVRLTSTLQTSATVVIRRRKQILN